MKSTSTNLLLEQQVLLAGLKQQLPELKKLLIAVQGHWQYEDSIYRFYHQSFKVYAVQALTRQIIDALAKISERPMNKWFLEITGEGFVGEFALRHNQEWLKYTRPQLEAFFHAKYMLEMAVKYGGLKQPPKMLPSGWAALLYLFNLR